MKKFSLKKFLKRFFKWTGITLLVIIILLILIPILFKDQIKEMVIEEVNKSLTAELSLEDFDLTFFSTFPDMTVQLHKAKLTGKNEFEGVELVNIKTITAHVGLWSVIAGDQVEVEEIYVDDPVVDVRILENGLANYDIVKPDSLKTEEELEEPSNFKLSLKKYEINNAKVKYDDRASNMYAVLDNMNHSGTGDLTADIIDFETKTTMDKMSYRMDGISYLTEVKTDAVVNMKMEFTDKSSKFTLKDNEIKLNSVNLSVDGYYEMFEGYDDMDLKLDASKTTFKDFLSLIPAFYHSGYESMVTSGNLKLGGEIKGKMDDKNLPGWDFKMNMDNGSIKYAGLPGKIKNISINAGSKFKGGSNLDNMTIDVSKFHANLSKNSIDANLFMNQLMTNPYIRSKVMANMDLSTLKEFIPMAKGESYSGILDADVDIDGKMSDLDAGDYEAFKASGVLELSRMKYTSESMAKPVLVKHMKFLFSPTKLTMDKLSAKMGNSDFAMKGDIRNYFGYFLRDEVLEGDFDFGSNFIDLDELMGVYPEGEEASEGGEATTDSGTESGPTLVPANLDVKMFTKVNKVKYNGITAKNVKGNMRIFNEEAKLSNFSMNAMGGAIGLSGSYNTRDHDNPQFDFSYTLNNIDVEQLTTNFVTVGKLAPIAKYAKGRINSNLTMHSDLDDNLMPVMKSITSNGDVSSNNLSVSGFTLLEKIEKVTRIKDISKQKLQNFRTFFSISDGKVVLSPFDMKMAGIDTKVSGYTTLDKDMNYKFAMKVPKEKIPASIVKEVENGLTLLNGLHPDIKLGDLPAFIPANVYAKGDPKNPKVTTDLTEQVKLAVKDKLGNVVDEVKETIKDSVQNIVDDKVDDVKEEIEKQKQKILEDAQKNADRIKAEAKKAADKTRKEADSHAEQLIKEAGSNPVKKKLAEKAAEEYKKTAYKKADQIEAEGDKQAEEVMRKAREQADKLG